MKKGKKTFRAGWRTTCVQLTEALTYKVALCTKINLRLNHTAGGLSRARVHHSGYDKWFIDSGDEMMKTGLRERVVVRDRNKQEENIEGEEREWMVGGRQHSSVHLVLEGEQQPHWRMMRRKLLPGSRLTWWIIARRECDARSHRSHLVIHVNNLNKLEPKQTGEGIRPQSLMTLAVWISDCDLFYYD